VLWILIALLAGIAWAIWFILQLDIWIPLLVTGVLGLIALGLFLNQLIRSRRSALALERALAEQGKLQAMNARPEKRAEIQALQKQLLDGINAIKRSKLGGKKRGAGALYSLPWYAIIGPPGAGKTTALKHSGMVFPYADTSIRGVGGTRNCDWWFTNEAILLDTAGRYATEQEDQQEWMAFLQMLLRYRGHKPLNGLIVAVAMPDIIDATEQQIEAMGKKLRARIDEVMTKLRMVLPVYLLITKCDLVAGFVEFFGSLRKSERSEAWGATVNINENKNDPSAVLQREFDLLVQRIHGRAVKRMVGERNRQARERIFQFPLEFAGVRRNLGDLVSTIFQVNPFQGTPLFRGFYFSSGTQEGRPLERVLARMGQAMGIQPLLAQPQQAVESKSYFLHDVFMKVVFPDAEVAARSALEIRRQKLVRVGVSLGALTLAALLAIPSTISFFNNRELLRTTEKLAKTASGITWGDSRPVSEKLNALQPVLDRLNELDTHQEEGVPFGYRFLMYQGDTLYRPTMRVFVSNMQQGFVKPCKYKLESQLKGVTGEHYLQERLALKTYLMLSDPDNLDIEWATGQYTSLWAELHEQTSDVALVDLKKRMAPFVLYYMQLLKEKKVTPVPPNQQIINKARETLQKVPVRKRYYAQFVEVIGEEKYDPAGDTSRANHKYPSLRLDDLFKDRPEVLKFFTSKQFKATNKWLEVDGPYTDKGHYAVLSNIEEGAKILEQENWVVPLTAEERGDRVVANVAKLAEDYEQQYIESWKKFLMDLDVQAPGSVKEAIDYYAALSKPEWPYLRVLRALEDHTQWKKDIKEKLEENPGLANLANRKINQKLTSRAKGLRFNLDVKKIAGKSSVVPATFKKTVAFGVPQDTTPGATPLTETALAQYMELLRTIRDKMVAAEDKEPGVAVQVVAIDLQNAMKQTEALLQPVDDMARTTLLPLLENPLNVAGKIGTKPAGLVFGK
jgi:type VI secretion system protein ImpL